MEAFFAYGFIQRAFLAGIFISGACAILGVFFLLRRDAMIGHGLAHTVFAGVALGLLVNIMPMAMALLVAVLTALGIVRLKEKAGLYGDWAIGIFSSVGLATGIFLATMANKMNVSLLGYLFGDILAIQPSEVYLSMALAAIVYILVVAFYRRLLYLTFDRESATAAGIRVVRLEGMLTILTAVTVVLGMKVVGILLVTALLVIPPATGLFLASSFKNALLISLGASVCSVVGGLVLAFYLDFPASASIVLLGFFMFGLVLLIRKGKRISLK